MPMLSNQASRLLGGGRVPWELAGGLIPRAAVVDARRFPAPRTQITSGLPLTGAWAVAFRTAMASVPTPAPGVGYIAFDAQVGRVVVCIVESVPNGYVLGGTNANFGLFASGDHTYMLISNGSSVQAYRDNITIGAAVVLDTDIGGLARWASRYDASAGSWYDWTAPVPGAALYNIAPDAAQRAGLHASMMALPAL